MRDDHLTPERLHKLLEEGASAEQNRLLLHHLALCPTCYAVGGYILDLYRDQAIDVSFCSVDLELARSRAEAPALWEKLEPFSRERQRGLVRDLPRFQTWGLAEYFCQRSERSTAGNPEDALHFALLAVAASSGVAEWQPAERSWLCELRALAFAHLANARSVAGDRAAAEQAFEQAESLWESGASNAGDVLGYEGRYLALQALTRQGLEREKVEGRDR
jgi:hypothetical protein